MLLCRYSHTVLLYIRTFRGKTCSDEILLVLATD